MTEFAPWIQENRPRSRHRRRGCQNAALVFPHAGGAAAAYRKLAKELSANGVDTYLLQYPCRADRLAHPAAPSIAELAAQLYGAGDWRSVAPLHLFGHCMGRHSGVRVRARSPSRRHTVRRLFASAGQAPVTIADSAPLPTTQPGLIADLVDLGGTDPRLLDDEDFIELPGLALQADYRALDGYRCGPEVRIDADIHAIGGPDDHRVTPELLRAWATHTRAPSPTPSSTAGTSTSTGTWPTSRDSSATAGDPSDDVG